MRFAFPIFAALMLLLPALPVPDFWITQSIYIGLYSLVALGLVLLTGVAGLTSFGQAAFVGVGAYTAAFLATRFSVSPWLTLLLGVALAVAAALVLGALTLRMSGHYLPLATIAWGLALNYTMANMEWLGKYDGILGIPTLKLAGIDLGTGRALHPLVWALALLAALAALNLLDSRPGRAIRALKNGATMAEAMGISTFRYKLTVFVFACRSSLQYSLHRNSLRVDQAGAPEPQELIAYPEVLFATAKRLCSQPDRHWHRQAECTLRFRCKDWFSPENRQLESNLRPDA